MKNPLLCEESRSTFTLNFYFPFTTMVLDIIYTLSANYDVMLATAKHKPSSKYYISVSRNLVKRTLLFIFISHIVRYTYSTAAVNENVYQPVTWQQFSTFS